jgi:hypothetical protein
MTQNNMFSPVSFLPIYQENERKRQKSGWAFCGLAVLTALPMTLRLLNLAIRHLDMLWV